MRVIINDGAPGRLLTQGEVAGVAGPQELVTIRSDQGEQPSEEGGAELLQVAQLAGVPRDTVESVRIPHPLRSGYTVALTRDELRNGFFGDPERRPLFATVDVLRGQGVRFFRPLRDDDDLNARDVIDTPNRGDLTVRLYTDNTERREVTATASDETPKPNVPVDFTATLQDPPAAEFSYRWDFGDGTTETGRTPSHAFPAGTWNVTVTVVGDDGSAGVSQPLVIQAGDPAAAPTPSPGATATPPPGPGPGGGGPAPSGGGTGAPDDGASGPKEGSPEAGGTPGPKATGTPGPSRPNPSPRPSPTATPSAGPTPEPTATPASSPEAADPTAAPGDPDATPTPTPASRDGDDARGEASSIDGVLLAGAGDIAQLERVLRSVPPPQLGEPSPARSGGGDAPAPLGWVGGGVGFFLLLGAGALRERRGAWL